MAVGSSVKIRIFAFERSCDNAAYAVFSLKECAGFFADLVNAADVIGVNIGCTQQGPSITKDSNGNVIYGEVKNLALKGAKESETLEHSYQPQVNNEAEEFYVSTFRRTLYVDDYYFGIVTADPAQ